MINSNILKTNQLILDYYCKEKIDIDNVVLVLAVHAIVAACDCISIPFGIQICVFFVTQGLSIMLQQRIFLFHVLFERQLILNKENQTPNLKSRVPGR